jgi:hypothetical protein
MISRRRFMAICFGLAAWFWCTAGAFAQARPASPQPEDAGRPAVAEAPRGNPWDAIEWVERRYKIEAMRFKARDETGVDWWGSDEVMVLTFDAKGKTASDEIGNIDSGETHELPGPPAESSLLRPWRASLGRPPFRADRSVPPPRTHGGNGVKPRRRVNHASGSEFLSSCL